MKFQLDEGLEILTNTPGVMRTLLAGLSPSWLEGNEGPDTWSPFDVVGHLFQTTRAMARQYEVAVGPWRKYLGVLRVPE